MNKKYREKARAEVANAAANYDLILKNQGEAAANAYLRSQSGIRDEINKARGYYQDSAGKWHRPDGKYASNAEVGLSQVGNGGSDTKPYANHRPSYRSGVVEEVWNNAKGPDGLVRDPNTGDIINWTPGESRQGVWDMGHIPEAKYSEVHSEYMKGNITLQDFLDWYNDPNNYRPELPSNNRSHKYE